MHGKDISVLWRAFWMSNSNSQSFYQVTVTDASWTGTCQFLQYVYYKIAFTFFHESFVLQICFISENLVRWDSSLLISLFGSVVEATKTVTSSKFGIQEKRLLRPNLILPVSWGVQTSFWSIQNSRFSVMWCGKRFWCVLLWYFCFIWKQTLVSFLLVVFQINC